MNSIYRFYLYSEAVTRRCFVNMDVLKNLKFTGKYLCRSLFFNEGLGSLQL